jgi:thiol-disulfide isomerase/thioredoxin
MDSKKDLKLEIWPVTLILILITLTLIQCNDRNVITFKQETGIIDGKIENYDGVFKSGKLSYFDAISRIVQNEIFVIDSTGCFKVPFNLVHPIYNTSLLDLQGHYYSLFLEPGKDLKITITGNKINFIGESGLSNIQINLIEDSINSRFKEEIKRCNSLHTTNIGYKDYLKEQIDLSNRILNFINEFEKTHDLNKGVLNAIKKETYYAPARSWINFRYDYTSGIPKERDTLFKNFYEDLFKTYPINDHDAVVSREYIDYISNIQSVLSPNLPCDTLINIFKNSNLFSAEELILIERAYRGDKSVFTSAEYKTFYNDSNRKKMTEIIYRNLVKKLISACRDLPKGIGRDLVISQGICSHYFSNNYFHPTENEWNSIKELIDTKFVLEYLLNLDNKIKIDSPGDQSSKQIPENIKELAANLNNEIIGKYKGKVIYIDFWATWCGPCRQEIPYSKVLVEQFKNKEVIFLSLCCKSNEQDWKNTLTHEKIPGEHYYVKDIDFDLLSSLYGIKGFPTYILIDKNGTIKNYNAPRPSSNEIIINEIQTLLD